MNAEEYYPIWYKERFKTHEVDADFPLLAHFRYEFAEAFANHKMREVLEGVKSSMYTNNDDGKFKPKVYDESNREHYLQGVIHIVDTLLSQLEQTNNETEQTK